jgi:hypothetical protein
MINANVTHYIRYLAARLDQIQLLADLIQPGTHTLIKQINRHPGAAVSAAAPDRWSWQAVRAVASQ